MEKKKKIGTRLVDAEGGREVALTEALKAWVDHIFLFALNMSFTDENRSVGKGQKVPVFF